MATRRRLTRAERDAFDRDGFVSDVMMPSLSAIRLLCEVMCSNS